MGRRRCPRAPNSCSPKRPAGQLGPARAATSGRTFPSAGGASLHDDPVGYRFLSLCPDRIPMVSRRGCIPHFVIGTSECGSTLNLLVLAKKALNRRTLPNWGSGRLSISVRGDIRPALSQRPNCLETVNRDYLNTPNTTFELLTMSLRAKCGMHPHVGVFDEGWGDFEGRPTAPLWFHIGVLDEERGRGTGTGWGPHIGVSHHVLVDDHQRCRARWLRLRRVRRPRQMGCTHTSAA